MRARRERRAPGRTGGSAKRYLKRATNAIAQDRPNRQAIIPMMPQFLSATVFVGLALSSVRAGADIRSDLNRGKIVAMTGSGGSNAPGRAMGAVDAPAEQIFRVLKDVASYQHFVPRIKASRRIGEKYFELKGNLPWPVGPTKVKLRFNWGKRGKVYVLTWKMLEGTLLRYEGSAWVHPWGKNRSLLTYEMLAKPRIPAPAALMHRGLRNASTNVLRAVRKYMAQRRSAVSAQKLSRR